MRILDHALSIFRESAFQKFNLLLTRILDTLSALLCTPLALLKKACVSSLSVFGVDSVAMGVKFLLSISLLIFIRGGLPRYRFDHLTKIGWIKFLTLVVCFLLLELLFLYTFTS